MLDSDESRLDIVGLVSGDRERYFQFDATPLHLTISADGTALYVVLSSRRVVTIDLDRLAFDPEAVFSLDIEPRRLAATLNSDLDNRLLVFGQHHRGNIALYDPESGEKLDEIEADRLLDPTRDPVGTGFWASTRLNELYYIRVISESIDLEGGQVLVGAAVGDHSWITEDGRFLIVSESGAMYQTEPLEFAGWLELPLVGEGQRIEIIGVATDPDVITVYAQRSSTATEDPYYVETTYFASTYNARTMHLIDGAQQEFTDRVVGGVYFQGALYHQISVDGVTTQTVQADHPCPGCSQNTEPVASFTRFPEQVFTDAEVTVDASASYDDEDPNNLLYRWSFDGGRSWDSEFSENPIATHKYFTPGTREIVLQVKDPLGLVGEHRLELEVVHRKRTAEKTDQEHAGNFDFRAGQSAFDASRGTLYLSEDDGTRLHWIDLDSGRATHVLEFGKTIIELWQSPFLNRLYVLFGEPMYVSRDGELEVLGALPGSYLAAVDTSSRKHIDTRVLHREVYDFVVTKDETVIYSAGNLSSEQNPLVVNKAGEGMVNIAYAFGADFRLRFGLEDDTLYSFTGRPASRFFPINVPEIVQYEINGTALNRIGDYDCPIGGNAWLPSPNGSLLFTRNGKVLSLEGCSVKFSLFEGEPEVDYVRDIQFSKDASFAAITLESGRVLRADGESYSDVEIVDGINDAYRAYPWGGDIRVITRTDATTRIVQ